MKKKIVSLFVSAVMLVAAFSLNVVAEDMDRDMVELVVAENYAEGEFFFENNPYTTEDDARVYAYASADESYAYAYVTCNIDSSLYAHAYVENAVDNLGYGRSGSRSASVDITLGELQGANEHPMTKSYSYTLYGSYDLEHAVYYG